MILTCFIGAGGCGAWKMSHVIHTCASLQNRVMLQIRTTDVICINESCHTYEVVMSHVWMSNFTCMNESRVNESCHVYE